MPSFAECRKCKVRWSSYTLCHCPNGCCQSFSDIEAFDCHRKNGVCVPAETVKMVQGKNKGEPRLIPATLRTIPETVVWKRNDFREHWRIDLPK